MSSNLQQEFSLSNQDALFKIDFKKYYDNTFNTSSPLWDSITKTSDFYGKYLEFPVPTTYKGGVSSGSLPETLGATYGDCKVNPKKVYATDRVDRESIMAALSSKGAFVQAISECIRKVVEADVWNHNRILFGNGDGSLGTISSVTDNGGGDYDIVITDATWKEANWEENMFVNIGSDTELFRIDSVTASTKTINLQRQSGGTTVPSGTDVVYLQKSKDNDPHGLKEVCDATSSTLYNITVNRKWQAYQRSVSVGISVPILNKAMIQVEKQSGQVPDKIVTSATQFEKLLNLIEDEKRYFRGTQVKSKSVGNYSFSAIEFSSAKGPVNIFWDKFCEDDRCYFLNSRHIKYFRRPRSGWVKDDIGGNGYLRVADEDTFEARFATYGNIFIAPTFQGVVTGLTT